MRPLYEQSDIREKQLEQIAVFADYKRNFWFAHIVYRDCDTCIL